MLSHSRLLRIAENTAEIPTRSRISGTILQVKTYRDEAIVLRSYDIGEADRVIVMLSRRHGKIRAVAKGVRKTKSRFGARVEPFSMVDVQIYIGKTLDTITQVETLNNYSRSISLDYDAYTAASAMVELADRIHEDEGEADEEQYLLLHGALHALATRRLAPDLVLNSYMLRAMALAGWAVALYDCARCGVEGPHAGFNVAAGGAVCDECRPAGTTMPSADLWSLLGALLSGDWERATMADEQTRRSAGSLIAAFVQWHIEKQVRALRYV